MSDSDCVIVQPHRARPIPGSGVRTLFDQEGWWPDRDEAMLARLVAAGPAVGAWSGGELVGFARLITDGTCRAYLEDLVVKRDMRGRGIGGELVQALHRELPDGAIVTAFFGPRLEVFYRRLGYSATHQVVAHHVRGHLARPPSGE